MENNVLAPKKNIVIVGAGPAGLMAAYCLAKRGQFHIAVYDQKTSPARKLLMAGKSGLNITFNTPKEKLIQHYTPQEWLEPMLLHFGAEDVCAWMTELGIDYYIGSSGRVFPTAMKASSLLRAWLRVLAQYGVELHLQHQWLGLAHTTSNTTQFQYAQHEKTVAYDALVLALGGGSWPELGSTGTWRAEFYTKGLATPSFYAANTAMPYAWSTFFKAAGEAVKGVTVWMPQQPDMRCTGDFVLTQTGMESGVIYPFSSALQVQIAREGHTTLCVDLLPQQTEQQTRKLLQQYQKLPMHKRWLKLGLSSAKSALIRECLPKAVWQEDTQLAAHIHALPIQFSLAADVTRAISTDGGVLPSAVDASLQLKSYTNVYCIGEMLAWNAPTGGYLLTGCLATAVHFARYYANQ